MASGWLYGVQLTAATYDNAGNMTAHPYITTGSGSITYDANNLVIEFTATGVTAEYAYDAQGQRVAKTVNGEVTIYVYDVRGRLAAEYTTETPTTTPGVYYRTTDHLDSTRAVTDGSGQLRQRRDFFPFGEEIPADSSHGNRNQIAGYNAPLGIYQQFTGQQRDAESGLDYFWARNFSGPLARFLSVDPANTGAGLAFPQSWNAYGYVINNPLKFIDPDGRECQYAVQGVPCFDVTTTGGGSELPSVTHFDSFDSARRASYDLRSSRFRAPHRGLPARRARACGLSSGQRPGRVAPIQLETRHRVNFPSLQHSP